MNSHRQGEVAVLAGQILDVQSNERAAKHNFQCPGLVGREAQGAHQQVGGACGRLCSYP